MENVFLYIGAQKSGTSSIYNILKDHPQINVANKKETKFFYKPDLYKEGIDYFKQTFFNNPKDEKPYLDIDPDYLYFEDIPRRIYESLGPDVKFIVTLRDPAIRAYSQYVMEVYRNTEKLSFEKAIMKESDRINSSYGNMFHSYIQRGLYSQQLERYLTYFSLDNFKFFIFEKDFLLDRKKMCDQICEFMNIDPINYANIDEKRNPRRKVKSKFLNRITRQNKLYNILTQKMLSKSIGENIRNFIQDKNTSQTNIAPLSQSEKTALTQKYFINDISSLERRTKINLNHWK